MTELEPYRPPAASLQVATRAHTDDWVDVVKPVAELAMQVANTEFVPEALRNKPEMITAVILAGRELGLPPMQAMREIHMVKGRPSLSAEHLRAMVLAAGHEIGYGEVSSSIAEVKGRRRGETSWTVIRWVLADAERAGLMRNDNWRKYPRQMLVARATADLIRMIFADVTHGIPAREELEESSGEPGGGGPGPDAPKATTKVGRRRASSGQAARPAASGEGLASPATEPATPAGPPEEIPLPPPPKAPDPVVTGDGLVSAGATPGEGHADQAPPADTAYEQMLEGNGWESDQALPDHTREKYADGPVPDKPAPITKADTVMLQSLFRTLGFTDEDRERRLQIASAIVGWDVTTFRSVGAAGGQLLTHDEAEEIRAFLAPCKTRQDVIAAMAQLAKDMRAEEEGEDG